MTDFLIGVAIVVALISFFAEAAMHSLLEYLLSALKKDENDGYSKWQIVGLIVFVTIVGAICWAIAQ